MPNVIFGARKGEFLVAQIFHFEASIRWKGGSFAHKLKGFPSERCLINAIYDPLGIVNKDANIHEPFPELVVHQGFKTIPDPKTYAGHVSPDVGE